MDKVLIHLFIKIKDNVIVPRVSLHRKDFRNYTDATIDHLEQFAKEGFRTLVLAYKIISEEDYTVRLLNVYCIFV